MRDLAEHLAAEARTLFAQLPDGEIGDDEPLDFAAPSGSLIVRTADGAFYFLHNGAAVRSRTLADDRTELTAFSDGHQIGRAVLEAGFDPATADPSAGAPWS